MGKILEKLMKKYWKNTKKNWKSQGNSSVQKSGNHVKGARPMGPWFSKNRTQNKKTLTAKAVTKLVFRPSPQKITLGNLVHDRCKQLTK